jgi:two-component system response regulator CpxR
MMLEPHKIEIADVAIHLGCREVYCDNQLIKMTGLEFNLLWLLMKNAPQTVSREIIAKHIFSRSITKANRSINMHVSTIRKKLLVQPKGSLIKTIRGEGYAFF